MLEGEQICSVAYEGGVVVRRCLLAVGTDLWGPGRRRLSPLIAVDTVPIRRPSAWAVGGGRAGWREGGGRGMGAGRAWEWWYGEAGSIFSFSGLAWPVWSVSRACYKTWWLRFGLSRVQELCESPGGRPGLSVLTSLLVSVDEKLYWTMFRHWYQFVPNMSNDIRWH